MQIGETIRKYRKERNMTQEEMAKRLGVTPPAVNKWENGNSYPDIMLLSPIARLLDISVDTLLSFRGELTDEEIRQIMSEADEKFKNHSYEEAFAFIRKMLEKYPNSEQLAWQLALMLDAHRIFGGVKDPEQYDLFITECYTRALESKNEDIRYKAAESLYNLWLRKEQYEEAEKCLEYMSRQNPERKRMQALVFGKTGRVQEAYRAYEELLLADYQMISMIFNSMYMLAVRDEDMEKARYYVEKQAGLARLFEMGEYYEISGRLDLAIVEKDEKTVADTAAKMKQNLLRCFKDEDTFGFMKENVRWKKLMEDL